MKCTRESITDVIAGRGGLLYIGKNTQDSGRCCILEAHSECIGIGWTDSPKLNRTWDIRAINDMPVSNGLRTEWMPRVMVAYEGAADWPLERQLSVCRRLVVETVRQIMSKLPGTPAEIAAQCRASGSMAEEAAGRARWRADAAEAAAEAVWRERAMVEARAMAEMADAAMVEARAMAAAALAAAAAGLAAVVAWLVAKSEKEKDAEIIFVTTCELWIDASLQQLHDGNYENA